MFNVKKYEFLNLSKKVLAVITTSISIMVNKECIALPQISNSNDEDNLKNQDYHKRKLKPKLVLKVNMQNPECSLLAYHSSHSSHSSHRSHYSSSGGGSDNGALGLIAVGGLLAFGAYQIGKNSKNKK